ncbi:Tas retrotransposon peptidase A16 [Ancylostoma ceylanicum]|uniref:Tas retrotransposon peptidase A16 n=1 Tax=Ancylostoma ceylanicum TaxID=53326 RepID=A0A0D6LI10_9BILA|nr:Tas retrotransposon peptidase A16 [Ancylostoma ceylanicum]
MSYELNATSKLVIEALENFTKTVDQVEEFQSGDQETQIQDYIDKTHTVLENAQTLTIQIERKKVGLQQPMSANEMPIAELSSAKDLQRRVLKDQIESEYSEQEWSMSKLLFDLDRLINAEEKINEMLHTNESFRNSEKPNIGQKRFENTPTRSTACVYCDSPNHNSLSMCEDKKHHFSICPKRMGKESATAQQKRNAPAGTPPIVKHVKHDRGKTPQRQNCAVTSDIQTLPETEDREASSLCVSNTELTPRQNNVLLLTGVAKVRNEKSGKLQDIEILLDTGADRSFILRQLAEDLELPIMDKVDLSVYTFGDKFPKRQQYDVSRLQIWDALGDTHNLHLCKTDTITEKAKQVRLTPEDVEYLQKKSITLSKKEDTPVNPQILLGCDQLWPLLSTTSPQYMLPSGLMVIPSKLGYLLSGRQERSSDKQHQRRKSEDFNMARIGTLDTEDIDKWDHYWSLDSSGIEEFGGAKHEEKAHINTKILQFFNKTIERRQDGYYVRLPFKETCETLPTNKTLAYRRLISAWNMLKSNGDLLHQYHKGR